MPLPEDSRYTTLSTVIRKDQRDAIEAFRRQLEAEAGGRMTFAEAVRRYLDRAADARSCAKISSDDTRTQKGAA